MVRVPSHAASGVERDEPVERNITQRFEIPAEVLLIGRELLAE
jgi:hypothetical protein